MGFDIFSLDTTDLYTFLKILKNKHIAIYHLEYQEDHTYTFLCTWRARRELLSLEGVKRIGSTGVLFFILSFISKKQRLFGLTLAVIFFLLLQQSVWRVNIEGSRESVNQSLEENLYQYNLHLGSKLKTSQELEEIQKQILKDYEQSIDWLNLYLDGHTYQITYTPKVKEEVKKANYSLFVASDDAIVDRIEVSKGNVLVQKNQHVKKGDVLISNEIIATNDEVKLIETEGKIYGYIYKTYEARMDADDSAEGFALLHLKLLEAASKEIGEDGRIDKENVLHYEAKEGTISLKVQFTLYKNIAQKEILNEQ